MLKYPLVTVSLAVALVLSVWPFISTLFTSHARMSSLALGVVWLATIILAVAKHKVPGLWALVGIPLVFWWPVILLIGCSRSGMCL